MKRTLVLAMAVMVLASGTVMAAETKSPLPTAPTQQPGNHNGNPTANLKDKHMFLRLQKWLRKNYVGPHTDKP